MSVAERMPDSVAVVPGPGQVAGFGIEISVVLSSCDPVGGLHEVEQRVAGTFFAQGISFEIIAVCAGCEHAGLEFTRIVPAAIPEAIGAARGAMIATVDVADAVVDPYELAEAYHRAVESGHAAGVRDVLDHLAW